MFLRLDIDFVIVYSMVSSLGSLPKALQWLSVSGLGGSLLLGGGDI